MSSPPPPEAVLDPTGRCLDAHGSALSPATRRRLGDAVRDQERARGSLERGNDEALELWEAVVEGRWSLVDRFDSDGRRHVLALRHRPPLRDPRRLTARERCVAEHAAEGRSGRWIALTLDLSTARVSGILSEVQRKLGAASHPELVQMVRALRTRLTPLSP